MPSFSSKSKTKLDTAHADLQKLFNEVIKHWDCTVLEGHRTEQRQNELYETGKSKVRYPNSKHNASPSRAVDVVPYPIDWNDWNRFYAFVGYVLATADQLGIEVVSGLDWNDNKNFKDQSFMDAPHFQLKNS